MLPSIVNRTRSFHSSALAAALISPSRRGKQVEAPRYRLDDEPNTVLVKLVGSNDELGYLRSPAEAFALLRDVERRFGPAREFKFIRDSELSTRYQAYLQVVFKDPASYRLAPKGPYTFSFIRPSLDIHRPGGVGLDELEALLEPLPAQPPTFKPPPPPKTQDSLESLSFSNVEEDVKAEEDVEKDDKQPRLFYKLTHYDDNFLYPPFGKPPLEASKVTSANFLKWGGFDKLQPMPFETPLRIEAAFRPTHIDHYRMRCALRQYSDLLGVPNPYEKGPEQQEVKPVSGQLEWEPLPGSESEPEDIPMPSRVLASKSSIPSSSEVASTSPEPQLHTTASTDAPTPKPKKRKSKAASAQPPAEPSPAPAQTSAPASTPPAKADARLNSVAQAQALASQMQTQAKSISRKQHKQEKYRTQGNQTVPLPNVQAKPAKPSLKDFRSQALKARQAEESARKLREEQKPVTIKEKISGFFSGLF